MKKLKTLHLPLSVDPKNNLAMTLKRFGSLTLPQQAEVLQAGASYGFKGTKDCDTDFVPPYARPGITIAELAKLHNDGIDGIESACRRVTNWQRMYDQPYLDAH